MRYFTGHQKKKRFSFGFVMQAAKMFEHATELPVLRYLLISKMKDSLLVLQIT